VKVFLKKGQSRKLADFFIDLAKGFILGVVGAALVNSQMNPLFVASGVVVSFIILLQGLYIYGKIEL